MKEAIDEARRALESLKTARQALTGVRKNADSIESALAAMEEKAKAALARADSLIARCAGGRRLERRMRFRLIRSRKAQMTRPDRGDHTA